jgi:cysteine desulfurase family protein
MTNTAEDKTIYLDNAATSFPKPESVYTAMDAFARQIGGSSGRSSHRKAVESATIVDSTREALSKLLGAPFPESVCFGLNASDALNTAIYGLAEPGKRIVTSSVEHNSVRRPLADLRMRMGCEVVEVPSDRNARWHPKDVISALTPDTSFVVLSWASNVTGVIQEIELVARACKCRNIPLVVDAAQTCGAYPMDFKSFGIAAMAFTGHKSLLGPQGTGGLIVHPDFASRIRPLKRGGSGTVSHSELQPEFLPDRFETGTMNCHGLAGLYAGASYLLSRGVESVRKHEMTLWQRLRDGLRDISHVKVFGADEQGQSMSIVSVTVDGMEPTDVGFILDMRFGVLSRTGLHCAPGAHQAIGTLPTGTARFSMGFMTSAEEIDELLYALAHIRERVRSASNGSSKSVAATTTADADVNASSESTHDDKQYQIDWLGFLIDKDRWDERFAVETAASLGMQGELTEEHWRIIRCIRDHTATTGRCPLVYQTCKKTGLGLADLQRLFPTGYLRGACKIAGISYETGSFNEPRAHKDEALPVFGGAATRSYSVTVHGFLLNPSEWDEAFAAGKAGELGLSCGLAEEHFRVIRFMRDHYKHKQLVPTVFETCAGCGISLEELELLFPTGYQRGAVKTAGLRVLR